MNRIPGLDFLRGIAVIAVMLYHLEIAPVVFSTGWAGVQMFFVLSGFLIAGLLFNEYNLTGKIRPGYFLIRRGFKIYPLFYFVVALQILYYLIKKIPFTHSEVFAEVFFYQNFSPGLLGITWSIAVEEHFYILLIIFLSAVSKKNKIKSGFFIPLTCIALCIASCGVRFIVFEQGSNNPYINYFPTYLRIDSLLFGVLLAYLFIYQSGWLDRNLKKHKKFCLVLACLMISPVFIFPRTGFFMSVFGHSFLYMGFGILMSCLITFYAEVDFFLKKCRLKNIFNLISWIGVYSFGIYLVHLTAGPMISNWIRLHISGDGPLAVYSIISVTGNIFTGVLFSLLVEKPFLLLREKYFPRINAMNAGIRF
ncbi:MAG: acyltransferase [Chitinophagaceae bacterium]